MEHDLKPFSTRHVWRAVVGLTLLVCASCQGGKKFYPVHGTVLVDGRPELSCLLLPVQVEGKAITTIEGMATGSTLHPLQQAFAELGAAQCGYCTPGILLSAKSLLETNTKPSRDEIREALAGNLCRCTGYAKILEAVELAAGRMT